ncbi:MAG: hypothetical protein ACK55K_00800 [Bacteroidota bacterium]
MKKLLIIYPNWLPSNAVGVQRVRLIVNFLHEYGWTPELVTVHSDYYEEEVSEDLKLLVDSSFKVHFVSAQPPKRHLRFYGDITLRAWHPLKQKSLELLKSGNFDAFWVPIPPFYTAVMARQLFDKIKVPYGIDYIDPWVHEFPGNKKWDLVRAKLSTWIAKLLEPYAVKNISFLTGVAEAYFIDVINRNRHLLNVPKVSMPYGFNPNDYQIKVNAPSFFGNSKQSVSDTYVYAGAFLPKSHDFIQILFKCLSILLQEKYINDTTHFLFVGTGSSKLKSINEYARDAGISHIVTEIKERISYLEVIKCLSLAKGVLAIGSTESHYTASKIFQSILSNKPVFPVFHKESSVVEILQKARANQYLVQYDASIDSFKFEEILMNQLKSYLLLQQGWEPDLSALNEYSAKASAKLLASILDVVVRK